MAVPVIDFSKFFGEQRGDAMALLHEACEKRGFFVIENHGIDAELMEKVKQLVNRYYDDYLKESFYQSEMAKSLDKSVSIPDTDWETTFFIWHRPTSNIKQIPNVSDELCKAVEEYIAQLVKVAETLSELMSENLGLEKEHIRKAFSGGSEKGARVGTKVAMYPQCRKPEAVRGLREHTDAGGIILLLQDDQVPGLEFLRDGKWVEIPPSKNNAIFVNIGDQVEVVSNGIYKSVTHRVMADKKGSRLSIATFYNPIGEAVISPAAKLMYPSGYTFGEYLKLYGSTKFGEKAPRFESMKKKNNVMPNAH